MNTKSHLAFIGVSIDVSSALITMLLISCNLNLLFLLTCCKKATK